MRRLKAVPDAALKARVVRRTPLEYGNRSDAAVDRPDHVRAASSMAHLTPPLEGREVLVVVQDDTNFLALVDPERHDVRSIRLPTGPGGAHVYGPRGGDRDQKLDLEACVRVPGHDGYLLAFGSGSTEAREWILEARFESESEPDTELHGANDFFRSLRASTEFAGRGLNVEGAVFVTPGTLRLFQRGNAPPDESGIDAVDATGDVDWPQLERYLRDPSADPPPLENVVRYDLGELHGVRITFSDAEFVEGTILYSASAEAADGTIVGSVLGVIRGDDVRQAELLDEDGNAFTGKVEGLAIVPGDPSRVCFVLDQDDPVEPSPIFEAKLEGSWYGAVPAGGQGSEGPGA